METTGKSEMNITEKNLRPRKSLAVCFLASLFVTVSIFSGIINTAASWASEGAIVRCSTSSAGVEGNGPSHLPSISADGRYAAFQSGASDLVDGDTNGATDIFRKDLQTGEIVRCSTSSAGGEGNGSSGAPSISADGRYVAFESFASNLADGDTNNALDVFRKDLETGEIVRCSTSSAGVEGNRESWGAAISPEARYVAFVSEASNLVDGDTNNALDVFRKDLQTGETVRCSTSAAGGEGNGWSGYPVIGSQGRYVSFVSTASNLVPWDENGATDVFRKDMLTGAIVRCSISSDGGEANGNNWSPAMSPDGRYVAFPSDASNLVPSDTNGKPDVFRKDMATGAIVRVSTTDAGAESNDWSGQPSIADDGRYIVFSSDASNLVADDNNAAADVFRKDLVGAGPRSFFSFYFAEGYTGSGFRTFLCLGNPGDEAVPAAVTYMFPDGSTQQQAVDIPARSRATVDVNGAVGPDREVSFKVTSESPFVAERPMYFDYQGKWKGGHNAVGAASPSQTVFFAEGYTGIGFDEWVCVLNPNGEAANLTFVFQTQEQGQIVKDGYSVPANSRKTFYVNETLGEDYQTSLKLESDRPIVAERPMYFS